MADKTRKIVKPLTKRSYAFRLLRERLLSIGKTIAEEYDMESIDEDYSLGKGYNASFGSYFTVTEEKGRLRKKEIERIVSNGLFNIGFVFVEPRKTGLFKIIIYFTIEPVCPSELKEKLVNHLNRNYDELVDGIEGWSIEIYEMKDEWG
jgi:hypothetical protein